MRQCELLIMCRKRRQGSLCRKRKEPFVRKLLVTGKMHPLLWFLSGCDYKLQVFFSSCYQPDQCLTKLCLDIFCRFWFVNVSVLGGCEPLLWRSFSHCLVSLRAAFILTLTRAFCHFWLLSVPSSCVRTESPAETLSRRSRHSQD